LNRISFFLKKDSFVPFVDKKDFLSTKGVNTSSLETRVEIEGNGRLSDDSWEALELGFKRVRIERIKRCILRILVMKRIIRSLSLCMERSR
jgi:hypothetical protein